MDTNREPPKNDEEEKPPITPVSAVFFATHAAVFASLFHRIEGVRTRGEAGEERVVWKPGKEKEESRSAFEAFRIINANVNSQKIKGQKQ